ncbi:hypothetical protein [Massilia horti]|uniref:hypothetical protein n=1 Tax=Massilia horti TaxID=2562153 RepID=UPI001431257A|nr:hypothetical protein [Massilia horti]
MKPTVNSTGDAPRESDDSPGFKTKYFADCSTIVVDEKGIFLVEKTTTYDESPPTPKERVSEQ